jgi:hypothetical protein
MHPDVSAFISEIVYAGRLHSDDSATRRTTSFGTGIRFEPVDHEGNKSSSDEEVAQVAASIAAMRNGTFTDADGATRLLRHDDFMVVAPYNAQVLRLRTALPAGVRVGTVDKFQGQEAPVVFFSMADLQRRGRAAQPVVPLLAQPPQRGHLPRPVPRCPRLLTATPGSALPVHRGDAAGECPLPPRRVRAADPQAR